MTPRSPAFLALLLPVALLARRSLDGPSVTEERADALLALHRELFTDRPRPVGSAEAAAARTRIALALGEAGCPVGEQVAWSCVPGKCARVVNLWCRLGPASGEAVVGLAHTDSVAAGPGAGDDGAGVVAWTDAVRTLAREPLARPFVLLLTDGEEEGLFGIRAALAAPPFPDPIAAVVNLEARGTGGASLLFETVGPPLAWGTLVARSGLRPNGSTTYTAIYDRMPNDTDLSVVRHAGIRGVNHAFVGHLAHYHTPLDDLAHLDVRSLAHHADAALAHVRALQSPPTGEEAFTDVLGLFVLRWPLGAGLPLAGLGALGWLAWLAADLRAARTRAAAVAAAVASVVALGAVAVGLAEAAGALIGGTAWWGNPAPVRVAVWAGTLATLLPLGAIGEPFARWHAVLGLAATGGIGLAWADPRFAVLLVPAVGLALAVRTAAWRWPGPGLSGLAVGLAAAWLPYAMGLEDALTLEHPLVIAVPLWFALTGAAPLLPARWGIGAVASLSVAAGAVAAGAAGPGYTPESPEHRNLVVTQDGDGSAVLEGLGEPVVLPPLGLAPPRIEPRPDGTVGLRTARAGRELWVLAEGPLALGATVAHPRDGWLVLVGVPPEGVEVRGPVRGLVEVADGLPDAVAPWVLRRGAAVPVGDGDRTRVEARR